MKRKTNVVTREGQGRSNWTDAARKNLANREATAEQVAAEPTLIRWLTVTATERRITLRDVASELGVTYGYIAQLRLGVRKLASVSDEFVTRAAAFLWLPRISVLAACGRVRLDDFVSVPNLEHSVDSAYAFIERDKVWGGVMPVSLRGADTQVKLFVIRLYEAATGKILIPYREQIPVEATATGGRRKEGA